MAEDIEKNLMKFYKVQNSNYSELVNDTLCGDESDEDEDTCIYVTNGRKGEANANYLRLERKEDRNGTKARNASFNIRTRTSKRCCSFSVICTVTFSSIAILVIIGTLSGVLTKNKQTKAPEAGSYGRKEIVPPQQFRTKIIWNASYTNFLTESAIRFVDINEDGVDDIITGFDTVFDEIVINGSSNLPRRDRHIMGGALALDGRTGSELWMRPTDHEVYALNCNGDLTQDGVADCLLGGRGGVFAAIDSKTGSLIWSFSHKAIHSEGMNLYTAQFIKDLNGDGIMEVLQVHGGDIQAPAYSKTRISGKILIVSGKDGSVLTWSETPDKRESYFSPLVYTVQNGTEMVIFGTGGETHGGSLFVIQLKELYEGRIERAVPVYRDIFKGVMNPPILVDLTGDSTDDLLIAFFNSTFAAIDGESLNIIWTYQVPNSETYSIPSPGYFNDDDVVDVMIRANVGPGFPVYYHSLVTILDGKTGVPITKPFRTSVGMQSSPLTIGFEGHGNDAFLYWTTDCAGHHEASREYGILSISGIRIDTCSLRYKTKEVKSLRIANSRLGFPGMQLNSFAVETHQRPNCTGKCPSHIGVADSPEEEMQGSLVQRLIGTGGLTKPIGSVRDRDGSMESIDVVFATIWLESTPDEGMTEEELHCAYKEYGVRKMKVPVNRVFNRNAEIIRKCLHRRNRRHGSEAGRQSSRLSIYRMNIKPVCEMRSQNRSCAKILPIARQEWGGYMGSLTNGHFIGKRRTKGRP